MITLLFSVLNSDLTVDPPEGSFSHAVEFDEDLPDPARLQQKDELLLQLPDVHTRWSCGGMKSQVLRDGNVPVSSYRSHAGDFLFDRQQNMTSEESTTWNVVERRQRLGAEVDGGRSLPHLLHQDLPLLLLQQLHEELMRWHHKQQRQLLQAFTQSPARYERFHLKDDLKIQFYVESVPRHMQKVKKTLHSDVVASYWFWYLKNKIS